jgi:uncharacterized protein (DUF302 family)
MRAPALLLVLTALALLASAPRPANAMPSGMVNKRSPYDVTQTLDRLQDLLQKNGFTVVTRIDDRALAKQGGEIVPPVQALIVSKPDFDAPLLKSERSIGLDLPLRILCWEDSDGHVNLTYPAPDLLAQRYNITNTPVAVAHMLQLLDQLTDQAVKP